MPDPILPAQPKAAQTRTDHIKRAIIVLAVGTAIISVLILVKAILTPPHRKDDRAIAQPAGTKPTETGDLNTEIAQYRAASARIDAQHPTAASTAGSGSGSGAADPDAEYVHNHIKDPMVVKDLVQPAPVQTQAQTAPAQQPLTPSSLAARYAAVQQKLRAAQDASLQKRSN
jgi:hypothetical protein